MKKYFSLVLLPKQGMHAGQFVLPGEAHGFLLHKNWLKAYNATFEFIERQFSKK
jgi:dipeptidyl aminopeptidase/acylaminoacyl peptidase